MFSFGFVSGLKVLLHIAVPYSCPLKVQPATPLDFFYPILVPSTSCWPPPGLGYNFPLRCHTTSVSSFIFLCIYKEGRETETKLCYQQNTVRQASLIVFHALLSLRNGLKPGNGRITFIPTVKAQPSVISQQLTAPIRYMCTPVPATAHLKTGSRNKHIPVFHYRTQNYLNHTTHRLTYFSSHASSYSSKVSDGNKSVRKHLMLLCSTECPILVLILILTGHTWSTPVQIKINQQ